MIANALFRKGIPYKYEMPLALNDGIVVHPDFTVLNARLRKEYYLEHRGMMDDRNYAKDAVRKLMEYEKAGYFLGDSLIITEETLTEPFTKRELDMLIEHYFL